MKAKILFVGLKLIEIPILVFIPWWVGKNVDVNLIMQWLVGLFVITITIVGGGMLIKSNWKLAKRIAGHTHTRPEHNHQWFDK